jgi:hypothetical protein
MCTPVLEKSGVLSLDNNYRKSIEQMVQSGEGIESFKKMNPLVEYLQPLASTCEYVKTRTVDQSTNSIWGYFDISCSENEKFMVVLRLSNKVIGAYVRPTISIIDQSDLVNDIYETINKKLGDYFSFELITDTKIKDQDATSFSLKKEHHDYSLMKDDETMAELHAKLSLFFSTVIEMVEAEFRR